MDRLNLGALLGVTAPIWDAFLCALQVLKCLDLDAAYPHLHCTEVAALYTLDCLSGKVFQVQVPAQATCLSPQVVKCPAVISIMPCYCALETSCILLLRQVLPPDCFRSAFLLHSVAVHMGGLQALSLRRKCPRGLPDQVLQVSRVLLCHITSRSYVLAAWMGHAPSSLA